MSADTTIVIAARTAEPCGELEYTAAVVQAAEDLFDSRDVVFAFQKAKAVFLMRPRTWFSSLGRAKQFANLLRDEERERCGGPEYKGKPIIEIGHDRLYRLSRKGNRLT